MSQQRKDRNSQTQGRIPLDQGRNTPVQGRNALVQGRSNLVQEVGEGEVVWMPHVAACGTPGVASGGLGEHRRWAGELRGTAPQALW